jgi:hypothetical protein
MVLVATAESPLRLDSARSILIVGRQPLRN